MTGIETTASLHRKLTFTQHGVEAAAKAFTLRRHQAKAAGQHAKSNPRFSIDDSGNVGARRDGDLVYALGARPLSRGRLALCALRRSACRGRRRATRRLALLRNFGCFTFQFGL